MEETPHIRRKRGIFFLCCNARGILHIRIHYYTSPLQSRYKFKLESAVSLYFFQLGSFQNQRSIDSTMSCARSLRFVPQIHRLSQLKSTQKSFTCLEQLEKAKIDEGYSMLQRSVKQLNFGDWIEKEIAAKEIKRLARSDLRTRKSLAGLGVIPSLMSMLDSEVWDHQRSAVQALLELANGTYTNKALMVEAGLVAKLPQLINTTNQTLKQEVSLLLQSISSLLNTQFHINSPQFLPFIVEILDSDTTNEEAKTACLATLCSLSTGLNNAEHLVSSGALSILIRLTLVKSSSEQALLTLRNLVVTTVGKKAMENEPAVMKCLSEVLRWEEKPRCQELATCILMVLADKNSSQREKMEQLRIVGALLELALLGNPLARKRALKLLEWFKDERVNKVGVHSGPQTRRISPRSHVNRREIREGRRIIKEMVKQSLDKNMELITRRANGCCEDCSKLKALIVSSSFKSLPF